MGSNVLIIVSIYLLEMENFTKEGRAIILFFILAFFGMPFISLTYVIGFLFTNPETAFKWTPGICMIIYAIPSLTMTLMEFYGSNSPLSNLIGVVSVVLNLISPYTNLSSSMTNLLNESTTTSSE